MRKLAIGLALASTALATPSMARDGQWYVGVDGGAMVVEDLKYKIIKIHPNHKMEFTLGI